MGDVAGFGADILTDPLNLLGAGALKSAYRTAAGPMYPGGMSKLALDAFPMADQDVVRGLGKTIAGLDPTTQKRVLGEIPPGSTPLGGGAEALAYKTPEGDVLRMEYGVVPPPPNIPEIRTPTRHAVYGTGEEGLTVQRMPYAEIPERNRYANRVAMRDEAKKLNESIAARGYDPFDVYDYNIGKVGDEWKVIDPSAVNWLGERPPNPKQLRARDTMSPIVAAMLAENTLARSGQ
jgi:hypothetical protein